MCGFDDSTVVEDIEENGYIKDRNIIETKEATTSVLCVEYDVYCFLFLNLFFVVCLIFVGWLYYMYYMCIVCSMW